LHEDLTCICIIGIYSGGCFHCEVRAEGEETLTI